MISFGTQSPPVTSAKISIEQRQAESPLVTPAYRKDIYNIFHKIPRRSLLHNWQCVDKDTSNKADQAAKSHAMFAMASNTSFRSGNNQSFQCITSDQATKSNSIPKKTHLRWLFKLPPPVNGQHNFNSCEFIATPDSPDTNMIEITMHALSAIGACDVASIAVTEAFEKLLTKEYIPWWTPEDVESLSIPFIAAFSRLLGGLDLHHTIRSRILELKDINLLISIPHIKTNVLPILELYQDPNA